MAEHRKPPRDAITVGSKWGYTYVGSWQVGAAVHEVKDLSIDTLRRQIVESPRYWGTAFTCTRFTQQPSTVRFSERCRPE